MIVCIFPMLFMLLFHFGINWLCYHARWSSMFLFCYQLRALTHVYPYCVVTRALHVSRHVVTRSQKVHVIFLNACMRHHGDDCEWTMMPNALWVKKDDLPGSCVCKMHLCHAYHKHSLMHSLYFLHDGVSNYWSIEFFILAKHGIESRTLF